VTLKALPLRDYQRAALDARAATGHQRSAIVLPTGAGKAVVLAHQSLEHGGRTLILVHTDELAQQALDKITKVAPGLDADIYMGRHKVLAKDMVVGGVQTVVRHLDELGTFTNLIIDECHRSAAPSYLKIMRHLGVFTPGGPRLTGYTATFGRSDERKLATVYEGVAFSRDISWMIRRRYLIPPVGRIVQVPDLDLAGVRSTRGEYDDAELGEALAESLAPELVAQAYVEHAWTTTGMCQDCLDAVDTLETDTSKRVRPDYCPDEACATNGPVRYRKAVGFAPTVAAAERFMQAFQAAGIPSEIVHGKLGKEERALVLKRHRARDFPVLWNCAVLIEGYDDPEIDCVIIGPVKSKNRYQQMAGRGLRVDPARPYEGQDCLLLGYAPTVLSHDLRSIIDLSERPLKEAKDGKSLIELEDELDAGEGVPDEVETFYKGPIVVGEFDPIGRPSTRVWLKTTGGTYFVKAGKKAYVFIMEYPTPGQWTVCTLHTDERRPRTSEHRGLPLDQALVWAEDLALDLGADLNTGRKAPWRKKPASEASVSLARGLGLKVAMDGLKVLERQGPLSDRIDVVIGSRKLDPIVTKVRGMR
jgi:superfamily II DNA or RNA helicase